MNQIFLGEPAQAIKDWFISTYLTGPDYSNWPTYTTLKFVDGSEQTKEIYGAATWQNIGVKSSWSSANDTLKSCQLGNKVTEISSWAFGDCRSLLSINIPSSVTSIGGSAFHGCSSLTSINIPNSVTSIGSFAFCNCHSLTSINIPNSVSSIGDSTFYECKSLTSINIPNYVTSIERGAFAYCTSLTSINIPNSVTSIGYGALSSCSSLTSVIFEGKTMTQITSMSDYPWGAKTSAIKPGIS